MKQIYFLLFIYFFTLILQAQEVTGYNTADSIQLKLGLTSPTGFYQNQLDLGKSMALSFVFFPNWFKNFWLEPELGMTIFNAQNLSDEKYNYFPLSLNASYQIPLSEHFMLPINLGGGVYLLKTTTFGTFFDLYLKASAGLSYYLSDEYKLGVQFGYEFYHDPKPLKTVTANLNFSYFFGEGQAGYNLKVLQPHLAPVFAAQYVKYYQQPAGKIVLENKSKVPLEDISASLFIKNFMPRKTGTLQKLPVIKERSQATLYLHAFFDKNIKYLSSDTETIAVLELEYKDSNGKKYIQRQTLPLFIYSKNAMNWDNLNHIGSFISLEDKPIIEMARKTMHLIQKKSALPENLNKALALFTFFKFYGLKYIHDPKAHYKIFTPSENQVSFVQYPRETLFKKSGNCVDFTVLFSALMESMAIPTAIVAVPEHVFILFEAEQPISGKTIFFQGRHWIPLETTFLDKDFTAAWKSAYDFYHQAKEKQVKTTLETITEFPPVTFEQDIYLNQPMNQFEFEKFYFAQEDLILKFLK